MSSSNGAGLSGMGIVTADISVTLDGFGAAADQSLEHPFGALDHLRLHAWQIDHRAEHAAEAAAIVEAGAFVMGRNMFGPGRGEWDLDWRGWWGTNPPYHAPVFVLSHHERDPLALEGGTTFHFVTGGIEDALDRARAAAGDRNVSIAGGASTLNQVLAADLLDELRLHVAPFTSGLTAGSRLFDGVPSLGLVPVASRTTEHVTHVTYRRA